MLDCDLLTPLDVSNRWRGRIGVKTLSNWRHEPGGSGPPFVRFGNRIFYPLTGLVAWEAAHTFTSTKNYGKQIDQRPSKAA